MEGAVLGDKPTAEESRKAQSTRAGGRRLKHVSRALGSFYWDEHSDGATPIHAGGKVLEKPSVRIPRRVEWRTKAPRVCSSACPDAKISSGTPNHFFGLLVIQVSK